MRTVAYLVVGLCLAGLSVMWGGGCSREEKPTSAKRVDVPEIVTPDISGLEQVVREQIESARNALAADPKDASANGKLAILYDLYHFPDAAETFYRRAAALDPTAHRWPYTLGRVHKKKGELAEAVAEFRAALEAKPDFLPALGELGDTLFLQGKDAEARAAYEKILEIDPDSPAARYALGKNDLDHGRYEEAGEHLKRVLVEEPRCGPVHRALAELYEKTGRPDRAARERLLGCSAEAVPGIPDDEAAALVAEATGSEYEAYRAQQLADAGQIREAMQHAENALEFAPDSAAAHVAKASVLYRIGRLDESLEALRTAAQLAPEDATILCQQAMVLIDQRQWDEAKDLLSKALELDPDNELARTKLAQVAINERRPETALEYLKPVVDANPNATEARLLYARSLLLMDRNDEGLADLTRLVSDAPSFGPAHVLLGEAYRLRGDLDAAIREYEAAIEAQPNNADAYVTLSNLYYTVGQYGQCDKVLRERAMKRAPRSLDVRNVLAWLTATCPDPMYRNGASAVKLAQAINRETQNQNPLYLDTLAAALAEVGKFEDAVQVQQLAIDLWKRQRSDPAPGMDERLKLYRSGQPYRVSPTVAAQPTTKPSADAGDSP